MSFILLFRFVCCWHQCRKSAATICLFKQDREKGRVGEKSQDLSFGKIGTLPAVMIILGEKLKFASIVCWKKCCFRSFDTEKLPGKSGNRSVL